MFETKCETLNNGLLIYNINYKCVDLNNDMLLNLVFRCGSMQEEPELKEMAHLLEHMSMSFDRCKLNTEYIYVKAATNFIDTTFTICCNQNQFENSIDLILSIFEGRYLKDTYMQIAKEDVKLEFLMNQKVNKFNNLKNQLLLNELTMAEHIPGLDVSCLKNIKIEDVKKFHSNFYRPDNAALFIVANTKHTQQLGEEIRNKLSSLQNKFEKLYNKTLDDLSFARRSNKKYISNLKTSEKMNEFICIMHQEENYWLKVKENFCLEVLIYTIEQEFIDTFDSAIMKLKETKISRFLNKVYFINFIIETTLNFEECKNIFFDFLKNHITNGINWNNKIIKYLKSIEYCSELGSKDIFSFYKEIYVYGYNIEFSQLNDILQYQKQLLSQIKSKDILKILEKVECEDEYIFIL